MCLWRLLISLLSDVPQGLPGDSSGEDTDDEEDEGPYQGIPEVIISVAFVLTLFSAPVEAHVSINH